MTDARHHSTSGRGRPRTVAIVNHRFQNTSIERAVLRGFDVIEIQAESANDVVAVGDLSAILITSTPALDAPLFAQLEHLVVVVRYGIGVDNIDVEAASEHGVLVCNVPHYGTDEVATHAITLGLTCFRRIIQGMREVEAGRWSVRGLGPISDVREATFGVLGFGQIGRSVAAKAAALGFQVLVNDAYVGPEIIRQAGAEPVTFDELLAGSDVLSLHAPLTDGTVNLFDATAFERMKGTAFLVNTSRGGLIDEAALIEALDTGQLAGAAVDVLSSEPPSQDSPLLRHEKVIVTPHSAWYSEHAMDRLQRQAAEQVAQAMSGEVPAHALNAPT